jgi:hypothetical protein
MKCCNLCGDMLIVGLNWYESFSRHCNYTCKKCHSKRNKTNTMYTNRSCASYLGVVIAEQYVSDTFDYTEHCNPTNPKYDFVFPDDKLINVKSSCLRHRKGHSDSWMFFINRNDEVDSFICLGFDNRNDLNLEHVWMIPSGEISHLSTLAISVNNLNKYSKYELDIDNMYEGEVE